MSLQLLPQDNVKGQLHLYLYVSDVASLILVATDFQSLV